MCRIKGSLLATNADKTSAPTHTRSANVEIYKHGSRCKLIDLERERDETELASTAMQNQVVEFHNPE